MSSNGGTSSEPPAKRAKVGHKHSSDVVDDCGAFDEVAPTTSSGDGDEATLAACAEKARELDEASDNTSSTRGETKIEDGAPRFTILQRFREPWPNSSLGRTALLFSPLRILPQPQTILLITRLAPSPLLPSASPSSPTSNLFFPLEKHLPDP